MTSSLKRLLAIIAISLLAIVHGLQPSPALALDTDIYAINPRPNVAILFDTSGSMGFGIYNNSVDYRSIYTNACAQQAAGTYGYTAYDRYDTAGNGGGVNNLYYKMFISHTGDLPVGNNYIDLNHQEIVLIKGSTKVTISTDADGNLLSQTGDAGAPTIIWDFANLKKTFTKLENGEIVRLNDSDAPRLSVNGTEETIYLDNAPLPLDRNTTLTNTQVYEDNTTVDLGFAGLLEAPGYYFSGYGSNYTGDPAATGAIATNNEDEVYYLASANWVYMMMAYQLYDKQDVVWYNNFYYAKDFSILANKTIPSTITWIEKTLATAIISPNYPADYDGISQTLKCGEIIQLDAAKIKLHFSELDLYSGDAKDTLEIRDKETGDTIGEITHSSNSSTGFYSAEFTVAGTYRRGLEIYLITDGKETVGKGFKINGYSYTANTSEYTMKTRLDAVRDAILFVVDDTRGSINWALAGFDDSGGGDGADIKQPFNPEHANDDAVRENIIQQLEKFEAYGGTPLGEAIQDMFNHFHDKDKDFSECSRQFCILISDGFPSVDTDWSRMDTGVTMTDTDGDNWTSDPSQSPVPSYLDDVADYMYNRIFRDPPLDPTKSFGGTVDDPENSFDNITTHTLSFAQDLPLLVDTADDGGGVSLAANSGQQMINALRSLAMLAIKSASYVAPVISVDTANKTQSGEWLYMAFFKPTADRWLGNLKKYKLVKKIKSGNCPNRTEEEWVVTDSLGDDNDAVDCDGQFHESSRSYWSTEVDGGEVIRGGVGALLRDQVKNTFKTGSYYTGRYIKVLKNEENGAFPAPVDFKPNIISNDDLGVASDAERYQIINYVHGYTFDADETDSTPSYAPSSYRYWPLGSFIHSNPNLITYENVTGGKTYIVIGSNDGMIHVFDDETGNEVVAFIPEDQLGRLKDLNPDKEAPLYKPSPLFFIDGQTSYHQEFSDEGKSIPKQLIFGLRRGGSSYYSINVENSDPSQWTLKWHIKGGTGDFSEMGESWSKMELMPIRTGTGDTDKTIAGVFTGGYDDEYDDASVIESPNANKPGCALYVIDIINSDASGITLLGNTAYKNAAGLQVADMKYAIPANPAVVPDKFGYLDTIYFSDLGGQIWNFDYSSYNFALKPRLVFQSNPGSGFHDSSGDIPSSATDKNDVGRRMFYSPTITLMGECNYRYTNDAGCDYTDLAYPDSTCKWTSRDFNTYALVVGTGDRENPNRKDINNRIYMILDTNESDPLNESNLFNVTMDETDIDSGADNYNNTSDADKKLKSDYLSTTNGWYIKLEDIDDTDEYAETIYHDGEKILARPIIFSGVAYIPSFTPITEDECYPKGQAKIYALKYCDGTAGVNFFKTNDDTGGTDPQIRFDYRDRYKVIGESIPSSPKVIIRDGKPAIFISVGGGLPTVESGDPPNPIEVINWREMRN
ncbi:MAG: hypothetical protein J7L25_06160 [Deltaproteobacteria bacterium]|nr:hypothetical protein [Candidatus Tharpella aukensis]